jgi:hypothetical protein
MKAASRAVAPTVRVVCSVPSLGGRVRWPPFIVPPTVFSNQSWADLLAATGIEVVYDRIVNDAELAATDVCVDNHVTMQHGNSSELPFFTHISDRWGLASASMETAEYARLVDYKFRQHGPKSYDDYIQRKRRYFEALPQFLLNQLNSRWSATGAPPAHLGAYLKVYTGGGSILSVAGSTYRDEASEIVQHLTPVVPRDLHAEESRRLLKAHKRCAYYFDPTVAQQASSDNNIHPDHMPIQGGLDYGHLRRKGVYTMSTSHVYTHEQYLTTGRDIAKVVADNGLECVVVNSMIGDWIVDKADGVRRLNSSFVPFAEVEPSYGVRFHQTDVSMLGNLAQLYIATELTALLIVPMMRIDGWAPTTWADFALMKRARSSRPSVVLDVEFGAFNPSRAKHTGADRMRAPPLTPAFSRLALISSGTDPRSSTDPGHSPNGPRPRGFLEGRRQQHLVCNARSDYCRNCYFSRTACFDAADHYAGDDMQSGDTTCDLFASRQMRVLPSRGCLGECDPAPPPPPPRPIRLHGQSSY